MSHIEADKIKKATSWSLAAEVAGKLISPISNMVLARLLSPEAFGVIATVTMITSFADMFTDAGFQKYLVQHEFKDDEDLHASTNVAFWSNLSISFFLWIIICLNREWLAETVGNPGLGNVVAVACISLPLTSFSSIQMALFRRSFDFKTLFLVRLISIFVPIIVTIPLAFAIRSYWALIIGTIVINALNAIVLTVKSRWKPILYYNFDILKQMFSFSIWTLVEQISIWLTSYVGTFIVGTKLTSYYVGIYKTSMTTVNQIMSLITSAVTPVLFSALSRTQNNDKEFHKIFYSFQKMVGLFVIPLGLGVYLYRDIVTSILLGDQWSEAKDFIGLWGLMSAVTIVFSHFSSEVYRAKGKPKLSFFVQCTHLAVLIPALIISVSSSFEALYITRSLIRFEIIIVNVIILSRFFDISFVSQFRNCFGTIISSLIMTVCAIFVRSLIPGLVWSLCSIIICIIVYFISIMMFKEERVIVLGFLSNLKKKIFRN
jgi:PST family polysaccharide transporter